MVKDVSVWMDIHELTDFAKDQPLIQYQMLLLIVNPIQWLSTESAFAIQGLHLLTKYALSAQVAQHVEQTAKIMALDSVFVIQDFINSTTIVFQVLPVLPQVQEMSKENVFVMQAWTNTVIIAQNVLSEPFMTTLQKNAFSFVDKIQIMIL